jgi:DNA-binding protein Fis
MTKIEGIQRQTYRLMGRISEVAVEMSLVAMIYEYIQNFINTDSAIQKLMGIHRHTGRRMTA